jgi:hypothetical protein
MGKSVYIETTIPSAHASRRSDPGSVHRRRITRAWWAEQAGAYELLTSEATLEELASGTTHGRTMPLHWLSPYL